MVGLFATLLLFAFANPMPFPLLVTAFVLIGFFTAPLALVLTHGRSLAAPHLLGRAITLLNIGAIGSGFLVQSISGVLINLFPMDGGVYPFGGLPAGVRAPGGARSDRLYRVFQKSGQALSQKSALR